MSNGAYIASAYADSRDLLPTGNLVAVTNAPAIEGEFDTNVWSRK